MHKALTLSSLLSLILILGGCGGGSDASFDSGGQRLLDSINVSPEQASVAVGQSQQYTASGLYTDGSTEDITDRVNWLAEDVAVAGVDDNGAATGLTVGSSRIQASLDGVSGDAVLAVTEAIVAEVVILPPVAEIKLGNTQDYRAFAVYSDKRVENITFTATWALQGESGIIVPFEPTLTRGLVQLDDFATVRGVEIGEDLLVAEFGSIRDEAEVAVVQRNLNQIRIEPVDATRLAASTVTYQATGFYQDGTTADLTKVVSWQSANTEVATISNDPGERGLANTLNPGETIISATLGSLTDQTSLNVLDPTSGFIRLDVSPARATIGVGERQAYSATAIASNGLSVDVTADASWSSSDGVVANIGSEGVAVGAAAGTTTISANFSVLTGTAVLTVSEPTVELKSIRVSPANATLLTLSRASYQATGFYSDGTQRDITQTVLWQSADRSIVTMSNDDTFAKGTAFALTTGVTNISATQGGITSQTRVTVINRDIDASLVITPLFTEIPVGGGVTYRAELILNDRGALNVTDLVSWSSGTTTVATITAGGEATGVGEGETTILAELGGRQTRLSATAALRVKPVDIVLESLQISPPTATTLLNGSQAYTAEAFYSDGSSEDVTSLVSWTSLNSNIASINASGLATGVEIGETRVRAYLDAGGSSAEDTAGIKVIQPPVREFLVAPGSTTVLAGTSQTFTATLWLADGTTQDVTTTSSWQSSAPEVAQVDATGTAIGLTQGNAEIAASINYQGELFSASGLLLVEVDAAVIESLQIEPAEASILVGQTQAFTAFVKLSDGSVIDVTRDVKWQSSAPDIAGINGQGAATGLEGGITLISAELIYEGATYTDSSELNVIANSIGIESLVVEPATAIVLVDTTAAFTARAILSDGTSRPVTDDVAWSTADREIAHVDAAGIATGLVPGTTEVIATLNYEGSSYTAQGLLEVTIAPGTEITRIRVLPVIESVYVGGAASYRAEAETSDGSVVDVSRDVSWTTGDADIATINRFGRATGLATGTTDILATLVTGGESYQGTAAIKVIPPEIEAETLIIEPAITSILQASRQAYVALIVFSDGSQQTVTDEVSWSSSSPDVAVISAAGIALGIREGDTNIQAEILIDGQRLSADAALNVISRTLPIIPADALKIAPTDASILVDTTQQYQATLELSDGRQLDVTTEVTWTILDASIAHINTSGLSSGIAPGITRVIAQLPLLGDRVLEAGASIEVLPPAITVVALEVTPQSGQLLVNGMLPYSATALLSDNTTQDVSRVVSWRSTTPGIAEIDNTGLATGVSGGVTMISARLDYGEGLVVTDEADLTVSESAVNLAVSPNPATLVTGNTVEFIATATLTDGSTLNVSNDVSWLSAADEIATIDQKGLATGLQPGETGIEARLAQATGTLSDTAQLDVIEPPPVIASLEIFPPSAIIPLGATQRYDATVIYEDGSTDDVTTLGNWSLTQDPPILQRYEAATVASSSNVDEFGNAIAVLVGKDTLLFEYRGMVAESNAEVTDPVLTEITISPRDRSVPVSETIAFTAYGLYSDSTSRDITDTATWSSANNTVASISNESPERGLATALVPGETQITATSANLTDSTRLRVDESPVIRIDVQPAQSSVRTDESAQFNANAIRENGQVSDITREASWSVGNDAIASINDVGLATGVSSGETDVIATFGNNSGQGQLIVTSGVQLEQIIIEPAAVEMLQLQVRDLTATAYYSDATSRNITQEVIWTVDESEIIRVSNGDLFGPGHVIGLQPGASTVRASLPDDPTQGTAAVTVIALPDIAEKLEVNPPVAEILVGQEQAYEALVLLGTGEKIDITRLSLWQSADRAIAVIDGLGLAHGESPGTAVITATVPGVSGLSADATLNVKPVVTIEELVVSPPDATIQITSSQRFTAAALLSDGTSVNVTNDVAWRTTDGDIARIDATGLATGVAAGDTSVIALLDYQDRLYEGSAALTVLPDITIEDIVVSPPNAEILVGGQQQYRADALLSDGNRVDISETAQWTTSDALTAQLAPGGLATGKAPGNVDVIAELSRDGISYMGSASLAVSAVSIDYVQVAPASESIIAGDSAQFGAIAVLTDGNTTDITGAANWFSSNEGVAKIQSGANAGLTTGLSEGSTRIYIEFTYDGVIYPCEGLPGCEARLNVLPPEVTELQVLPSLARIAAGEDQSFEALAVMSDNTRIDVTDEVTWRSANSAIASIDQAGTASGLTEGTVQITAILVNDGSRLEDSATLRVAAAPVDILDIIVSPADQTILVNETLDYTATALLSDDSQVDITDSVSWVSADTNIAHIDGAGVATGLDAGNTDIIARYLTADDMLSGQTRLTVESPVTIESITIAPRSAAILTGDNVQFKARAILSDLREFDVTRDAIWLTSDDTIAVVSQGTNAGLATGTGSGDVRIWIELTVDGTSYPCEGEPGCEAILNVQDPVVVDSLQVTPGLSSVQVDGTQQFVADLTFSDGTVIDVTDQVSWQSSDPEIAATQNSTGLFIGVAPGSINVTASGDYEGVALSDSARLNVDPADITIDRLEVSPPIVERFPGDTGKFIATAYLSNGEARDVTDDTRWRSSDTDVVTIDPTNGEAIAIAVGVADITGRLEYEDAAIEDSSVVTISERQPLVLEIDPASQSAAAGDQSDFFATLYYEGGTSEPVTASVTWQSDSTDIATISNFPGSQGVASAISEGRVEITATHASGLDATASYLVTAPSLVSLVIDPDAFDLVSGTSDQLSAVATFADDSVLIVNEQADWSTSDSSVLTVGNRDAGGVVNGFDAGSATITASYLDQTATASGTVVANVLLDGWIEPASNTLEAGNTQNYRAFGEFADGNNQEITQDVDWNSTNPAVAVVSNQNNQLIGAIKGQVEALSGGQTNITASLDGSVFDSSPLAVNEPTLASLIVEPSAAELLPGETAYFTATATFSDSSMRDVTNQSVWRTSDSAVASVENTSGISAVVTAIAEGSTSLTANFDGIEDSANIVVDAANGVCDGKPDSVLIIADQTVPEGQQVQFTALGIYPDGCEQDITESNQTVWQSRDKKICDFDGPKGGLATGLKEGIGDVEVTHRGVTDNATCTVTARED